MARPGAIMALRRAITTIMPRRDVTHQRGATMGPLPGATRRVTPQDITTARRPITTTGGRVFQGAPLTNKSGAPCFFEARYENMPAYARDSGDDASYKPSRYGLSPESGVAYPLPGSRESRSQPPER